jgi:predicted ATPase/class 3 adenylate cyclase
VGTQFPSGTVTFLFTDMEGSTKLLHAVGAEAYAAALAEHRRVLRDAFGRHGGVEVDTQGDAFFVAFPTAPGALAAAADATEALGDGPIRVRIGLHTGTPHLTEEGYVGADVHRAARIAAAGHGGQILVSTATAQLVDAGDLRDLGLHRLKDLSAPERIFQLGEEDHPALKTLHQTNLPVPVTAFLGREPELAELAAFLRRDEVRLVTLTGPGGTGKTRLALQAVAAVADAFPDGVWWVPLAALRDPALVEPSAAAVLGASGDLVDHIGDKRLLLLFDNFEHLTPAAGDLAELLARCPNVKLVVTSREPLHIGGEHEYAVDPLRRDDAVELFLTRAMAVKRDFAANGEVQQICERLDHLPLAIELAAARVKILAPAALLERLEQRLPLLAGGQRDAPERQRTLRATIEWSHELLTDTEQRLFGRLAVFRGGWTLEAAEGVTDADLDSLQSLVDKSLIRVRDTGRFLMLETIREFAAERLAASGEANELRGRHAAIFLALAEEAEPHVFKDDLAWVNRLEADHDNLRAALDEFAAEGHVERFQRMAAALWRFWYLRSHPVEGLRVLRTAVELDDRATADRATALRGASVMAQALGDEAAGLRFGQQALELDRALGNQWGIAYSTMMIANCLAEAHDDMRDMAAARDRMAEAAELFERIGDRHYGLIATHNQGWILGDLGDREGERRIHEESLRMARERGNASIEADALAQLGMAAGAEGRLDDAVRLLREAIKIDHPRGMIEYLATNFGRLSYWLARRGEYDDAARLIENEPRFIAELGGRMPWWAQERYDETVAALREKMGEEALSRARADGRSLSVDETVSLALGEDSPPD